MIAFDVPILAYHRIGALEPDHVPTVTPKAFERQMRFLARHQYQVVSFADVVASLRTGVVARRCVAITFDDGYAGTFTHAAPILRQFGFSATVFVAPAEVDRAGFMSWTQVQALSQDGFTIGSHTMRHIFLPSVSLEHARLEVVESKQVLEAKLQQPVRWFCYPVGGFTPHVQRLVQEAGYEAACTTNRGISKWTRDIFALRRIKVTERDRPLTLWAKLSGYYDLFRRLEPPG